MQQKISAAESEAERMLLPGAHSTEPGEAGEILPVWVELFRKYFEKKKSALSKTAQQEQFRTTLRTMRNTLVPPSNSLDHCDGNSELSRKQRLLLLIMQQLILWLQLAVRYL